MHRLSAIERYPTPGALAQALDPSVRQTPALDILDAALLDVESGSDPRLIFTMPPQEGKSERVSKWFVLWYLIRHPDTRIVVVSYADSLARRWGIAVRLLIQSHPQLGLKLRDDVAAAKEWKLDGHEGGMICVGVGAGLTGRPADMMIIDDPHAGRDEADSDTIRESVHDWWKGTGSTRLSPHARVVIIQTRWHEDDLAGRQLTEHRRRWRLINIPAQCEDEATDLLHRALDEFMESAQGRDLADWLNRKEDAGSRDWIALYQGRPSAAEGNVFKRAWWQISSIQHAYRQPDGTIDAPGWSELLISIDATFKDSKGSDFVVMQVWGRRVGQAALLHQIRGRWDFPTTLAKLIELRAEWPRVSTVLIEDKANGPAIIASLRNKVPGVIAYDPKSSKEARAHAVAPSVEAGGIQIPDPKRHAWVSDFIEECAGFPNGAHDDQVDAMTQALHRFFLRGGLSSFMDELRRERGSLVG